MAHSIYFEEKINGDSGEDMAIKAEELLPLQCQMIVWGEQARKRPRLNN